MGFTRLRWFTGQSALMSQRYLRKKDSNRAWYLRVADYSTGQGTERCYSVDPYWITDAHYHPCLRLSFMGKGLNY